MSDVTRFNIDSYDPFDHVICDDGKYILYYDYAKLKQERDELTAQVEVKDAALRECDEVFTFYNEFQYRALENLRKSLSITPSAALWEIEARALEELLQRDSNPAFRSWIRRIAEDKRKGE